MTHDELLVKMDKEVEMAEFEDACGDGNDPRIARALRAVVELHKPEPLDERGDVCLTCCPDLLTLYPCPTIQAIEKELF
jgi:hypothetical protein